MKKLKMLLRRTIDRLMGGSLSELRSQNTHIIKELQKVDRVGDQHYRDLIDLVVGIRSIRHNKSIKLVTEHPVALNSIDYIYPSDIMGGNFRHHGFYKKCRQLYGEGLSFLDLGCAGGGLVFEFALNGHVSIGLEGSNIQKSLGRANWRTIPDNLFCCDITRDFKLLDCFKNTTRRFTVISCWEVLEHIPEDGLETFFLNVKRHSEDGGIFIGSICRIPSFHHVTIQDEGWWADKFSEHGFRILPKAEVNFNFYEFCQPFPNLDIKKNPEQGFHFVAQKR